MKKNIYIAALLAINSFCMQEIELEIQENKKITKKRKLRKKKKETKVEVFDMLVNTKELKNKWHAKRAIKELKKHAKWLKTQTPQKRCIRTIFNNRQFIANNKEDLKIVYKTMLKYPEEKKAALKANEEPQYYIGPISQNNIETCGLCCLDTCARSSLCCCISGPLYACCCLISPFFACLSPWFPAPEEDFLLDEATFRPPNNITKKIWKDSALEKCLGKLLDRE